MIPPFAYYGGKQRMAHNIVPLLPKHTVYVEPFCGAGTIMFQKPHPQGLPSNYYREVLNDTNRLIANFFTVLRDNGEALCNKLALTLYSQSDHAKAKSMCKAQESHEPLGLAWAWFVNIEQSFGNKAGSGWGTGVSSMNGAVSWVNKVNALPSYIDRMRGVYLASEDFRRCIGRWDSPQTLFYIDPPYVGSDQGHYNGFTQSDLDDLIAILKSIRGSFVLSGYANEALSEAESWGWEHFEFIASAGVNNVNAVQGKARIEHVWRKFAAEKPAKDIADMYAHPAFDPYAPHAWEPKKQPEMF